MESCYGCGIRAEQHPMVAVMKHDEEEATKVESDPGKLWMAVPVCSACHTDPAHRTAAIKGTFFARADATVALRLADMHNIRTPGK